MAGFLETIFKSKNDTTKTKQTTAAKPAGKSAEALHASITVERPVKAEAEPYEDISTGDTSIKDTSIKDIIDHLQELVENDSRSKDAADEVPSFEEFPEPVDMAETNSFREGQEAAEKAAAEGEEIPEQSAEAESPASAELKISAEPETSVESGNEEMIVREKEQTAVDTSDDDYLLSQIEELRTKALNLKAIMAEKESQAKELESIVEVRENKAEELQKILDERQEKADGITSQVEKQIDKLIEKVENRMVTIERSMNADAERLDNSVNSTLQNMQKDTDARLEEIRILSKDTEPYRRIAEEQTYVLQASMDADNKEMLLELEKMKAQLESLKGDVAEKIHSENVKCYRNVSDLIRENDKEQKETQKTMDGRLSTIKGFTIGIAVCTVLNICGIAAMILYMMGFIHF